MRVRLFGRLRDAVGADFDVAVPHDVMDSEHLRAWLGTRHPALLDRSVKMAIDDRILLASAPIGGAREVAFLPPVSGG